MDLQESEIGNFFFGRGHPMKPYRVRLTHEIIQALSLEKKLTNLPKSRLTTSEMSKFHTDEYGSARADHCAQGHTDAAAGRLTWRAPPQVYRVLEAGGPIQLF